MRPRALTESEEPVHSPTPCERAWVAGVALFPSALRPYLGQRSIVYSRACSIPSLAAAPVSEAISRLARC